MFVESMLRSSFTIKMTNIFVNVKGKANQIICKVEKCFLPSCVSLVSARKFSLTAEPKGKLKLREYPSKHERFRQEDPKHFLCHKTAC